MKTIHFINIVATYITLGLYLSIFFGMMAQIILGPLQLLLAIIISVKYYKELDQYHQILIIYYWFACVSALIIIGTIVFGKFKGMSAIIGFFPIPMAIACYFLYVTKKIDNYLSQSSES